MLIFHTQLIDAERGIIRASVCHCLSTAKATLAAYMAEYTVNLDTPTTIDPGNLIEWFNEAQEGAVIACSFYDTDKETHTEFVASDERGNKPLITVQRAIVLAAEDDEGGDDLLMSMEAAGHA